MITYTPKFIKGDNVIVEFVGMPVDERDHLFDVVKYRKVQLSGFTDSVTGVVIGSELEDLERKNNGDSEVWFYFVEVTVHDLNEGVIKVIIRVKENYLKRVQKVGLAATIKQIVVDDNKVYGLGEDNGIYFWDERGHWKRSGTTDTKNYRFGTINW